MRTYKYKYANINKYIRHQGYQAIYIMGPKERTPVKIGHAKNVKLRLSSMNTHNWVDIFLHHVVWTAGRPMAERIERAVHANLIDRGKLIKGEWFNITPEEGEILIKLHAREARGWLKTTDIITKEIDRALDRVYRMSDI